MRAAVERRADTGSSSAKTSTVYFRDMLNRNYFVMVFPTIWSLEMTPRRDDVVERTPSLVSPQPASGPREPRSFLEHLAPDQVRFSRTRSRREARRKQTALLKLNFYTCCRWDFTRCLWSRPPPAAAHVFPVKTISKSALGASVWSGVGLEFWPLSLVSSSV